MQTRQCPAPALLRDGRLRRHRNRTRLRASRPRGGLEFQEPPHGAGRSPAGPRGQSRPLEARPRPAAQPWLEGPNRHQSQLLHGRADHGARPAEAIWHHACHHNHASGDLRRRLPRRALHGYQCQRHPLHRWRRGKDAAGNPEDPRRFPRRSHRAAPRQGQRALQSRTCCRWPHRHGFGRILGEADRSRRAPRLRPFQQRPAAAPPSQRAAASRHLHGRKRSPPAAPRCRARTRHGGVHRPPAPLPCARLQVLRAAPHPRGCPRGSRRSERRVDALGRDAGLMIVMKFGGTSLESAAAIERVASIVKARASRRPVVVVSAMGKTTNKLLAIASAAIDGAPEEYIRQIHDLRDFHSREARLVVPLADRAELDRLLDEHFQELTELVKGLAVLGELTPRSIDAISSYGERLSSYIVSLAFRHFGMDTAHLDSRQVIVTDRRHTQAAPLYPETYARLAAIVPALAENKIVVMGGFIAATEDGVTTTLGRGGSDYTAAIVGAGIDAEEIQIWTDVDGMLTADPTILPGGHRVKTISFAEAAELAYFGAKVLHPATVVPAIEKNIPVMILNSRRPDVPGTRITSESVHCDNVVKSIACKRKITTVNIHSTRMLMAHGFLRRIFEVFDRYETPVDMVATSEVSVSLTIDNTRHIDLILGEIRQFAEATVEHDGVIVCLVGENIRYTPGVARSEERR